MRWLIDFDSTLCNTFLSQIEALNQHFGTSHTVEEFTDWGMTNLNEEEIAFIWGKDCWLNDDLHRNATTVPHSVETLRAMIDSGEEAFVVTDRGAHLHEVTKEWLANHGLGDVEVFFTRSPFSKSDQDMSIPTKSQVAYYKRMNVVVEDAPHHSMSLAQRSFIDKVYLIDTPSNRHVAHPKITRITSWREIP